MTAVPGQQMQTEMAEQPAVLAQLVASFSVVRPAVAALAPTPGAGIVLIARGSSDNAAIFGRYVLEWALRTPVALAAPSLATRYGRVPAVAGWLAIAISQSGHTPEIVNTLQMFRAAGSRTVAVTNAAGTPLAQHADLTVELGAGPERAVPATKTVTTSFAALALIADALAGGIWPTEDWMAVADAVSGVLDTAALVEPAAELLIGKPGSIHVGRGFSYPVALESALKMKETSAVPAEGSSSADYLHGPIAAAAHRPSVCYSLPGPTYDDVAALAGRLHRDGSPTIALGAAIDHADVNVPVLDGLPEPLAALPLLVRAQQLALGVALGSRTDPDQPVGLNKVTRTS